MIGRQALAEREREGEREKEREIERGGAQTYRHSYRDIERQRKMENKRGRDTGKRRERICRMGRAANVRQKHEGENQRGINNHRRSNIPLSFSVGERHQQIDTEKKRVKGRARERGRLGVSRSGRSMKAKQREVNEQAC